MPASCVFHTTPRSLSTARGSPPATATMGDFGLSDDLLELAAERANTALQMFMLMDSDADGKVAIEQAAKIPRPAPSVARQPRASPPQIGRAHV